MFLNKGSVKICHEPGHFYSPICDPQDLLAREKEIWRTALPKGIDFDDDGHARLLEGAFVDYLPDFDYPQEGKRDEDLSNYYVGNSQFSWLDARALFVLMRHFRPTRIIEVGSGYSSLLMADVNRRFLNGGCRIQCIEPYPRPFLIRGVDGLDEVIVRRVQEVPTALFEALGENDVLFIDSSHVGKTGSDVNHLYFEVLPCLKPGVLVHIHDIFLPNEYPKEWAIEENRSWNEQYLLRALLMYSTAFKPVFGCSYAWWRFPDKVSHVLGLPSGQGYGGGSIWIRRV